MGYLAPEDYLYLVAAVLSKVTQGKSISATPNPYFYLNKIGPNINTIRTNNDKLTNFPTNNPVPSSSLSTHCTGYGITTDPCRNLDPCLFNPCPVSPCVMNLCPAPYNRLTMDANNSSGSPYLVINSPKTSSTIINSNSKTIVNKPIQQPTQNTIVHRLHGNENECKPSFWTDNYAGLNSML